MKKTALFASVFATISFATIAQDVPKNDPGYHINNYKHSNKAAQMAKQNTAGIPVSENVTLSNNYKQANTKNVGRALEVVRTEPREVYLSRQNYKMPFNTLKKEEKNIAIKSDSVNNDNMIN